MPPFSTSSFKFFRGSSVTVDAELVAAELVLPVRMVRGLPGGSSEGDAGPLFAPGKSSSGMCKNGLTAKAPEMDFDAR